MKQETKRGLFASTVLAGLAFAVPAMAQAPTPTPAPAPEAAAEEEDDVVIVTGSRLRRETLDSPNPTVTVGAAELEARGLANIGDAIEDIPLVGLGGNTRGTQTQNGDSFILPDILDLGSQRTLTLVNGRRIQPTLPGTVFVPGNASGSQVDLGLFNPEIVEKVEVVAGTGGAIYGADAVGGVINIITKDDYEGLNLNVQAGVTELGDGEQYRIGGVAGKNFLGDRANITLTFDYFNQDLIRTSNEEPARYLGSGISNPLEGSVRNPATFSAAAAAASLATGGAIASPFLPTASDGIPANFFGPLSLASPLTNGNGVLLGRQQLRGVTANTQLVPAVPVLPLLANSAADPQGFAFFAPTALPAGVDPNTVISTLAPGTSTAGLSTAQIGALALNLLQRNRPTPLEYFKANPTLNPLLFLGTFGTVSTTSPTGATVAAGVVNQVNGFFPTVTNTDPATSALFPRIAVPLQFDASGNLVPYNPGNYGPNSLGLLGLAFGGQGYDSTKEGHLQVQAGQERISFGGLSRFDLTDNIRLKNEIFYTKTEFESTGGVISNSSNGSASAGTFAVPIFIDQNPFVSASALSTINGLQSQGMVIPTLASVSAGVTPVPPSATSSSANERVLFLGRSLTDLFPNGIPTKNENENWRIFQGIEGDFKVGEREFYFDANAYYGRSETNSTTKSILDQEFALAIDVVQGPNGPVCRQQTLAAPESIAVRNPGLGAGLVTGVGLIPTAAQVAACVPLNLFGNARPSAAAMNYVTREQTTSSINSLEVYSAGVNGDFIKLPAGFAKIGVQVEQRMESAEFEPDRNLQQGLTQTALQFTGGGEREFIEYGVEALLPIFGEDFNFPGFRELEFNYAFRQVEREQTTPFSPIQGSGTDDDTFNYSFRWKPVDDLTLRGARSRTVRSASLVELFDPGIRAFTGLNANTHPCTTSSISQGPSPATRRANCIAAVQLVGLASNDTDAATFLSTFVGTASPPNRVATAAGNPFLANEEGNAYTIGFTYEPSFVPRLTLAADFFSVDITGELGLVGPPTTVNACFDQSSFPASVVGAANPACDTILLGNGTGNIPTVNPLTGRQTILTTAFGGTPTTFGAFEIVAADFLNLNLAKRQLRAVNVEARYNFELGELPVVGGFMDTWGSMFLRGTLYHLQRYDIFTPTLNQVAKEHGNPEFETRMEFRHEVGNFDQTLQWFWTSDTVTNVQTLTSRVEQNPNFVANDFHYFNYFAGYEINDNFTARIVVNNLFDTDEPRGIYGIGNDFDGGVGREFLVGVSARF